MNWSVSPMALREEARTTGAICCSRGPEVAGLDRAAAAYHCRDGALRFWKR
jgi:hypothetical protein